MFVGIDRRVLSGGQFSCSLYYPCLALFCSFFFFFPFFYAFPPIFSIGQLWRPQAFVAPLFLFLFYFMVLMVSFGLLVA
jgi:hypothetical protein